MQIFEEKVARSEIFLLKNEANEIDAILFTENANKLISKHTSFAPTCLRCFFPRCTKFSKKEIGISICESFPSFDNNDVCPTNAIQITPETGIPLIKPDICIKCGLCATRCPIGAISYSKNKFTVIETISDKYEKVHLSEKTIEVQNNQIESLLTINRQGSILRESNDLFRDIYERAKHLTNTQQNLLIRNLLLELGLCAKLSRIGDVYTRMDIIFRSSSNKIGPLEVEFNSDTLSAVRDILDDIAILEKRYGIKKSESCSFIVCLSLPNNRQGFWQIIKDIKTVLNVKISTATLGILLILLWNYKEIVINEYYIDSDNRTLRDVLEKKINRAIGISEKYLGILEPSK